MRILTLAAAALLMAACASSGSDGNDDFIADFDADLNSVGGSGITGNVRAVASVGSTALTLNLSNARAAARHPWHVHRGDCGSGGAIVGATSSYPIIEVDEDGTERVFATIDVQLSDNQDYHVNVHASPNDLGTIVSCGNLVD